MHVQTSAADVPFLHTKNNASLKLIPRLSYMTHA